MVRFCSIMILFLVSCEGIKERKLDDGLTKIPNEKSFFDKNYRSKYDIVLLNEIDTNAVYIESFYIDTEGKRYDLKTNSNSFINGLKFYGNGCLNNFIFNKDSLNNLPNLDPAVRGYRGICYKNKKDTLIEIISPIDETYNLGKKKYAIKVQSDTLFLVDKKTASKYIYLKQRLKENTIWYKADW